MAPIAIEGPSAGVMYGANSSWLEDDAGLDAFECATYMGVLSIPMKGAVGVRSSTMPSKGVPG